MGNEPLPAFYMILTCFWGLIMLGWLIIFICFKSLIKPLHTFLVLVTFSKLSVVVSKNNNNNKFFKKMK